MLAKVWTCAVVGLEGELVQVEVDIARQGLPSSSWSACRTRPCRRRASGCGRPSGTAACSSRRARITVNLAPAEMRKSGPSYDLPIAIGVLLASGRSPPTSRRSSSWASCRWTARCATCRACCRWSGWRESAGMRTALRAGRGRCRGGAGRRAST